MTSFLKFIFIFAGGFVLSTFKRHSSLSILLAAVPLSAGAEDAPYRASQATPSSAICMPMSEFQKFSVDEGGFTVNNFSVREVKDILSDMTQLETTYSIANRSTQTVRVSGDFVFLDNDNRILAAMSADPYEPQIDQSMTTKGRGQTFVATGTLPTVETVCLRIFGTLPDKK
ncbi:hypothetical protein [Agrobacterium sp. T29]|uniref:hypothetical protein n=1 Tax=Agrobacterium sp. T29 TaxID=2580515 RepID=UPI00115CCF02|nr:hypothetical protein [Agrobacterium sp. T29]